MLGIEELRSIVVVAREKSITKAAQLLHVTQPTLSTRIRRLEEYVGFPLLERNWEGVKLTNKGQYFVAYAIQMIQNLDDAIAILNKDSQNGYVLPIFKKEGTERLVIGIAQRLTDSLIGPIASVLRDYYPDIECTFITRTTNIVVDLVELGVIHMGIFYYTQNRHGLHTIPLIEDEMVLLCSERDYLAMNGELSNIEFLKNSPIVLSDNPSQTVYFNHFAKLFPYELTGRYRKFHIVNNTLLMIDIVANGNAFAMVPKSLVLPFMNRSYPIRYIELSPAVPKIPIHIAYSPSASHSAPIKHIAQTIIDTLINGKVP